MNVMKKIAKSKVLAFPLMVLAQIVSGTSFAIFSEEDEMMRL